MVVEGVVDPEVGLWGDQHSHKQVVFVEAWISVVKGMEEVEVGE